MIDLIRLVIPDEAHFEPTVYVNKQIKKVQSVPTNDIYTVIWCGIFWVPYLFLLPMTVTRE